MLKVKTFNIHFQTSLVKEDKVETEIDNVVVRGLAREYLIGIIVAALLIALLIAVFIFLVRQLFDFLALLEKKS